GIGLVNKLLAYVEQDGGADTIDANLRIGLPVDCRDYGDAAGVLHALGVRSVRLLTNNPDKVRGLESAGVAVEAVEPIPTAPHARNLDYLRTKEQRLGHVRPAGPPVAEAGPTTILDTVDVSPLMGTPAPHRHRPYVILKFAQTLDGRIATATGDARWISGEGERRISHGMRAACDAVLVGIGTVMQDDPQLTVRMVPGASPLRIVLDSTLRIPDGAKVLDSEVPTLVITTDRSDPTRRRQLQQRGVRIELAPPSTEGVDLSAALGILRAVGVESLLVEGGAKVITSMLGGRHVDRLVVGVASTIIGEGTDAVGTLGVTRVRDGIRLADRIVHVLDEDVVLGWNVLS
ncbi:MAG TPA: dihydrofolate reductase family protein, partial [Mycobacteriales bacterium]|nr:dihydrofolate reductase family protein [Mycobacteriales bacterium]